MSSSSTSDGLRSQACRCKAVYMFLLHRPSPHVVVNSVTLTMYVAPTAEHPNPWLLVEEFRRGASYAKASAFDGVELHGANGYLFAQFFDPISNQWKDEIVELGLAYVQLVRFVSWQDATYNKVSRATQMDVLAEFSPLIKNTSTKLLLNGDLSPTQGEELVSSGLVDAVVYGRPFINNADFVKRIFINTRLNEELDHPLVPATFYNIFGDAEKGYTDYPDAVEALRSIRA